MKRSILIVGSILALALVLVGAAFVGGRLLNRQQPAQRAGSGKQVMIQSGGKTAQTFRLDMNPAPELPTTPADVRGIFQRRADSSFWIGSGRVSMSAMKSQDGTISMTSSFDGPVIEVVVAHDTTVYRDVTMKQYDAPPAGDQKMQQVVEPGSLDEIGENSSLIVWGDKRGDRIVARVLVYSLPAILNKRP